MLNWPTHTPTHGLQCALLSRGDDSGYNYISAVSTSNHLHSTQAAWMMQRPDCVHVSLTLTVMFSLTACHKPLGWLTTYLTAGPYVQVNSHKYRHPHSRLKPPRNVINYFWTSQYSDKVFKGLMITYLPSRSFQTCMNLFLSKEKGQKLKGAKRIMN